MQQSLVLFFNRQVFQMKSRKLITEIELIKNGFFKTFHQNTVSYFYPCSEQ